MQASNYSKIPRSNIRHKQHSIIYKMIRNLYMSNKGSQLPPVLPSYKPTRAPTTPVTNLVDEKEYIGYEYSGIYITYIFLLIYLFVILDTYILWYILDKSYLWFWFMSILSQFYTLYKIIINRDKQEKTFLEKVKFYCNILKKIDFMIIFGLFCIFIVGFCIRYGIYTYILKGDEDTLNVLIFSIFLPISLGLPTIWLGSTVFESLKHKKVKFPTNIHIGESFFFIVIAGSLGKIYLFLSGGMTFSTSNVIIESISARTVQKAAIPIFMGGMDISDKLEQDTPLGPIMNPNVRQLEPVIKLQSYIMGRYAGALVLKSNLPYRNNFYTNLSILPGQPAYLELESGFIGKTAFMKQYNTYFTYMESQNIQRQYLPMFREIINHYGQDVRISAMLSNPYQSYARTMQNIVDHYFNNKLGFSRNGTSVIWQDAFYNKNLLVHLELNDVNIKWPYILERCTQQCFIKTEEFNQKSCYAICSKGKETAFFIYSKDAHSSLNYHNKAPMYNGLLGLGVLHSTIGFIRQINTPFPQMLTYDITSLNNYSPIHGQVKPGLGILAHCILVQMTSCSEAPSYFGIGTGQGWYIPPSPNPLNPCPIVAVTMKDRDSAILTRVMPNGKFLRD